MSVVTNRIANMQAEMKKLGVDAVYVNSAENHLYFSGFDNPDGYVVITFDKTYLFALRQNLVRDTLLRAANNIRFGDRRSVLGAIAARPELFGAETYAPRWHPLLKRPLLDRILKGRECRTLLYLRIALRRSSLRLRGRFNA